MCDTFFLCCFFGPLIGHYPQSEKHYFYGITGLSLVVSTEAGSPKLQGGVLD